MADQYLFDILSPDHGYHQTFHYQQTQYYQEQAWPTDLCLCHKCGYDGSQPVTTLPMDDEYAALYPSAIAATAEETSTHHDHALHGHPFMSIPDLMTAISTYDANSVITEEESVMEDNGRMYHTYKQGRYLMPNDSAEQSRLDLQHSMWTMLLDGKSHLAPVASPTHVLDIATGTGIWAIEFARANPCSHVVGMDISLIQPAGAAPNFSAVRCDAEYDRWDLPQRFDLVHLRSVFGCFDRPDRVLRAAWNHLAPGGWIELQDMLPELRSHDGTVWNTPVDVYWTRVQLAAAHSGRDFLVARRYRELLLQAGFVDVQEKRLVIPGNPWPCQAKWKGIGAFQQKSHEDGSLGFCWKIFQYLGMTPSEIRDFEAVTTRASADQRLHYWFPAYVVYGRKLHR